MNINFLEVYNKYNEGFSLLTEEKKLLDILISMPYLIEFKDKEYDNSRKVRELVNYLNNSSKVVIASDS